LRHHRKPENVKDYKFLDTLGNTVRLSQLFAGSADLILIHNMGVHCSYCTLWADGFNGLLKHIENRATLVLESPDLPTIQRKFAADRGWLFRTVSSRGTSFRRDMKYADAKNNPWPGISVFTRSKNGKITRASHASLGPGDNYCALWDLFDLLPAGWSGDPSSDGETIDYFYSKIR